MHETTPAMPARGASKSERLACLPMYDLAEVRDDNNRIWRFLDAELTRRGLENVPHRLDRRIAAGDAWRDPALLLSQTCGYPYAHDLHGRVRLVATPCYAAPGCDGPYYRSWLVARTGDGRSGLAGFQGKRLVINGPDSLSGCKVIEMMLPPDATMDGFFDAILTSGGHAQSIALVARGDADIAAIDCVTWALLARLRPTLVDGIRIVGEGPLLPGLPLITAVGTDGHELNCLRESLNAVMVEESLESSRRRLELKGFVQVGEDPYLAILDRLQRRPA